MIPNNTVRAEAALQKAEPGPRRPSVEEGHRLLVAFSAIASPDTRARILRLVVDEAQREEPEHPRG